MLVFEFLITAGDARYVLHLWGADDYDAVRSVLRYLCGAAQVVGDNDWVTIKYKSSKKFSPFIALVPVKGER